MADAIKSPRPPGGDADWLRLQKKIFARFIQQRLRAGGVKDVSIPHDQILEKLKDGILLVQLLEVLSGQKWPEKPLAVQTMRAKQLDQLNVIIKWFTTMKVDLKGCSSENIADGQEKAVFGLIFSIILKYMKLEDPDAEGADGDVREALKLWFNNKTQGYANVKIDNFKSSFHDGLALCALIHKMRPKIIPWETLSPGKESAISNLTLAMDMGAKYCNVEKYLEPEDICKLDEISMVVYLFDWYYGVVLLQKQDVAARRIGKLINMTKLHDKMRADYIAAATKITQWTDSTVARINGITFDNTLPGIRSILADFYTYKQTEKGQKIVEDLDTNALFNNLALRLDANKRPPFKPAGLEPADIANKFANLEKVETDRSVAFHNELTRQLELDKLQKRFHADTGKVQEWVASEKGYMNKAEVADLVDTAKSNLDTHTLHEKDVASMRGTRVKDLGELAAKLDADNYHKKADIAAAFKSVEGQFNELDALAASKRKVLEADLAREKEKDDTACKNFAACINSFLGSVNDRKQALSKRTGEVEAQLADVEKQIGSFPGESDAKIAELTSLQAAIDARHITHNPHTNAQVADAAAIKQQYGLVLSKTQELLKQQLEEKKRKGLSEDQVKEINDNFVYFDKDKSGYLSKKELRRCLASLGESATPADVDKILAEYDKDKSGKISKEEFSEFMKKILGDNDSEEEIVAGWTLIALDKPTVVEDALRILVNNVSWHDHHVGYLKSEQKDAAFGADMDYKVWTAAVFKR